MSDTELPPPIPAATVILIRDGDDGLETLMLHRSSDVAFGGMWTFPGGRIDDEDRRADDDDDDEACGRRAAVREAEEECALVVDLEAVVGFAHWTPPPVEPRRYATWFFLAPVAPGEVVVDGSEMVDHRWISPAEMLERRDAGEVSLAPPTWVTLHDLAEAATVEHALDLARRRDPVPRYLTHFAAVEGGGITMWQGDAGYDTSDPHAPGPRHRLWMLRSGWRLERDA